MFVNFSEETQHILKQAEKESNELNHPYVGSEHLMLSLLKDSRLVDVFNKNKITYNKFKNKLVSLVGTGSNKPDFVLYTPLLRKALEDSVIEARETNNKMVNPEILIISILEYEDGIAYSILKGLKINIDKLYSDIKHKKGVKNIKHKTLLLEELGSDITKLAKEKKLDPVIGRNKEIDQTIEILLRRKKNNPILIGPAGVGKTAIVEEIANIIVSDHCPTFLKNKRIISLNVFSLVSGTKYRGEFEEKMKTIIKELEDNDDVVLFIDEIHTIVGAGGAEGAIDASNIFKPALARGLIKIIGATTIDEYKKYIEPDSALARRFQNVMINEPNTNEVEKILLKIKPLYEHYHNVTISNDLTKLIVSLSKTYLKNRYEPDKSIDILDEVCAKTSSKESHNEHKSKMLNDRIDSIRKEKFLALSNNNFKRATYLKNEENKLNNKLNNFSTVQKVVDKDTIIDVIKSKGNIPIIKFDNDRKSFYNKLDCELNNSVIGEEANVSKIIRSLKKKDYLQKEKVYSILLIGAHGSGKTLLINEYLKLLSYDKNIIRLDLSEYKEYHTISKLIGTTAGYLGYDNKNNIFESVRTNPNTAFIIDNYEQACEEVRSLFINILENNMVTDASGKAINFSSAQLMFTAIKEQNNEQLGFNNKHVDNDSDLIKQLMAKTSLTIRMSDLSHDNIVKIVSNKISKIINKYSDINIDIDVDKLCNNLKLTNLNTLLSSIESQIIEGLIDDKKSITIMNNDEESNITC